MVKMTEHRISLAQLSKIRDGSGHSIFGASGSHMYLACAGSLIANILAPDEAGYDAAWGTVAHAVAELWLRTGRAPMHLFGQKRAVGKELEDMHLVEIDEEMFDAAEMCVDACEWQVGDHLIEAHVDFSHLTPIPNQGGTLDFAAMSKGRAHVRDHKFGASPENIVYAEENPQLMLYTIGLFRDPKYQHYGFKDFIIGINQPRLNHFDEWHTTSKRLIEFEDFARERMRAAWKFDAPRTPGPKQCRFCKVRATCAANARLQEELISAAFQDETVQTAEQMRDFIHRLDDDLEDFAMEKAHVSELTTAQLAKLIKFRPMAEAWWKAAQAELDRRAHRGEKIPGMKIVEGRSTRQFISEKKAVDCLQALGLSIDEIKPRELVSPAQAEKALRKKGHAMSEIPKLISDVVRRPPGRAALVPMSDRRPEAQDAAALVFGPADSEATEEEI